jgi:hypothetical protein
VVVLLIREGFTGMAAKLATEKAAEAFDTIVDFLESFETLDDPRQRAKVLYPLDEVLLLVLLGVIAGCESWVEIARYGEKKLALLRRFRPFADETPSHDQLGDIFAVLDAEQFQTCFVAWAASLTGLDAGIIAIDGKTRPCSARLRHDGAPIRTVARRLRSTWCLRGAQSRTSFSAKSRLPTSRTRSRPSRSCSTC